jgi:hypothetical protein
MVLKGSIDGWKIYARLEIPKRSVQFNAQNQLLHLKGTALLNPNYTLLSSHIQIGSDQLLTSLPFTASGFLLANLVVEREEGGYKGRLNWKIPNLKVEKVRVGALKGNGVALWQGGNLTGSLSAEPLAEANFDLHLGSIITGTTNVVIENLQSLHIPNAYGKLEMKGEWKENEGAQALSLDGKATDFYYDTFFAKSASLYSDLVDPFHKISGLFDVEVEKGRWHDLHLETATFETKSEEDQWTFRFFGEGKWNHPLEVHMNGVFKDDFKADVESFRGTFYSHPFQLINPVHFEFEKNRFSLPDVKIAIAGGEAFFDIDRRENDSNLKVRLSHLPLDFLSLNPLDVSVAGRINLEADVKERNNELEGNLNARIEEMWVAEIKASGKVNGSFDRNLLKLKGNFLVSETPLLNLDLSLPIHFSLWPFRAEILTHQSAKGELKLDGRVEDFLDFFNLGPHRVEGLCHCDLHFTNTLYRPLVEGTLTLQNGFYQNYYTGTELHNVQAELFAEKNHLFLKRLSAQDALKTGTVTGHGEIELLQSDLYPFQADLEIDNLQFMEIDLVKAAANGKVHIEGNAQSMLAKGDVEIIQSQFTIPDHIPRPVPNLEVTYRNPIHPIQPPQTSYHPYPLHLDLHISAPRSITISGRGLESEWKGDFHLGGTLTSPAAQGKLELIDGEFNFSTRSFKLTEGSLTLSGLEHEMPYLNLAASTETKGITINARLKGPLDDPQITLQSSPALPLGSIMSYLLFGQDISEIGGFQALELASSLASLAGTGPDVMESTRRSLGVDRLRVITDPTEEGGETVSLQVGKYVSKGVLVSFTQGVDESSTNISVEVELRGNFVFQIESDQRQEQGKFTLKWNLNY